MRTVYTVELESQLREFQPRLEQLPGREMKRTLGPGKWSGKEILGHLTDSAAINRQRIVRAQYEGVYDFPDYNASQWVRVQCYKFYEWDDLIALYVSAYRHLLHILDHLPEESALGKCPVTFSSNDYVTLDWLVGHVCRHNRHHLLQIFWLVGESDLPDERELNRPIEELP